MTDVVSSMSGPELIGLVAVVGGLLVALAVVVVPFHTWARRVEAVTQLKRELVAAGYPAEEIERIVQAGRTRVADPTPRTTPRSSCRVPY